MMTDPEQPNRTLNTDTEQTTAWNAEGFAPYQCLVVLQCFVQYGEEVGFRMLLSLCWSWWY